MSTRTQRARINLGLGLLLLLAVGVAVTTRLDLPGHQGQVVQDVLGEPFALEEVQSLTIQTQEGEQYLHKGESIDRWYVGEGDVTPAQKEFVERALKDIQRWSVRAVVAERDTDLEAFGLAPSQRWQIQVETKDESVPINIAIGAVTEDENGFFAQNIDDERVLQVSGEKRLLQPETWELLQSTEEEGGE